ncbi:MAG: hypothetical protein ABI968_02170 [Acidobacteriota bacterium]
MPASRSALALLLAIAAFVAACASSKNPAPAVPMAGARSDISTLAGRWEGEYRSEATGRTGSIVFELKSGDTVARGDVLMVPKDSGAARAPSRLPGTSETARTMPQVLSISFVSASQGVVRGTMDPYRDPDCDCEVQTTFVGQVSGNTISGTFATTGTGATPITTGRWSISRKKP